MKKKVIEYLHIDYSRNCATALSLNVIVNLMLDSSGKCSDLMPLQLLTRLSPMCQIDSTFLDIVSYFTPSLLRLVK